MKNGIFIALIFTVALLYTGCKKDAPASNNPITMGTTASDSYFPVTVGSSWRYQDGETYYNLAITDTTTTFQGNSYLNASNIADSGVRGYEEYFYASGHLFGTKFTTLTYGHFDLQVLNDTMAVGHSWTAPPAYEALLPELQATCTTTILEKGISLTLAKVTFTDVIHTQVDIRYLINGSYQEYGKYDFYFAKGVGIIKSVFNLSAETREIRAYDIK